MDIFLQFGKKIENLPSKPDNILYGPGGDDGILLTWNKVAARTNTVPECNNLLMLTKVHREPNEKCHIYRDSGSRFCIEYTFQRSRALTDVSTSLLKLNHNSKLFFTIHFGH